MRVEKYFILILAFLSFSVSSWAFIVPQVYVGGAVSHKKSTVNLNVPGLNNERSSFNSSSYIFNVGVRPLDIPIIGDFRIEGQYLGALSSNKDDQYGLVLYYDIFRFLPIVNPYIGVGTQYATYKIKSKNDLIDNRNKSLYSFHAGLNASLPVFPLDIYLEYRYSATVGSNSNPSSYKIKSNDIVIGAKYYIVK